MRVGKWILILLTIAISAVAVVGTLMAQADSSAVPPPSPHMQFILGMGILAAYIAREVGGLLVGLWNKAGGWLDGKSNGLKQATAVALTGALGLGLNAIMQALTHATNWMVTFFLALVAGLISTVSAGVTISAVKSKLTSSERSAIASR